MRERVGGETRGKSGTLVSETCRDYKNPSDEFSIRVVDIHRTNFTWHLE